jgi:hypothetical protein
MSGSIRPGKIEIHDGPASLAATYDGTRYAVEVSDGISRIELHLSEDDADRLGGWLAGGATRMHRRRQEDRQYRPGQEPDDESVTW